MIRKAKIGRDLLVIAILTLITILVWVGMDVYRSLIKQEVPEVLRKQVLPLEPELETKVFDYLESRDEGY